jgi:hypothetical protein
MISPPYGFLGICCVCDASRGAVFDSGPNNTASNTVPGQANAAARAESKCAVRKGRAGIVSRRRSAYSARQSIMGGTGAARVI